MLIDPILDGAIATVHSDQKPLLPTTAMACDDVRHAAYLGGYCTAKSPLGMEPLPLMVPKDPLRQSMGGFLMTSDHAPFPIGSNAAIMVDMG